MTPVKSTCVNKGISNVKIQIVNLDNDYFDQCNLNYCVTFVKIFIKCATAKYVKHNMIRSKYNLHESSLFYFQFPFLVTKLSLHLLHLRFLLVTDFTQMPTNLLFQLLLSFQLAPFLQLLLFLV